MKIEQKFAVAAPVDRVWSFLVDPYAVVTCLPGAAITEKLDDRAYAGTLTVKLGPVTASYKGKVVFQRLDPAVHEAEIVGQGREARGRGSAELRMVSRVHPLEGGGSEVSVVAEVIIVGLLAQFGRGMIQDVSDQLVEQFTARMKSTLAADSPALGGQAADPVDVFTVGSKAVARAATRVFRRLLGRTG